MPVQISISEKNDYTRTSDMLQQIRRVFSCLMVLFPEQDSLFCVSLSHIISYIWIIQYLVSALPVRLYLFE
ncbi:hypothetical protein EJ05DRAFT_474092 [Pseudovirgaria hyperparasitica]|uniref:Uncharacterized protein n=1 Tax=Pseudovirgaria hyperparasitica TaxID=470096 RepID=A0A6A6WBH1_9PEZI|nr:uncharacterized protein EJ05DRAFT_474092 [Pseudovirgaria hyperparasitica]KAF2760198.1 hypothetical protein EJ05DRAFT_474092 [Pseudovirgaria hyperparasitica]